MRRCRLLVLYPGGSPGRSPVFPDVSEARSAVEGRPQVDHRLQALQLVQRLAGFVLDSLTQLLPLGVDGCRGAVCGHRRAVLQLAMILSPTSSSTGITQTHPPRRSYLSPHRRLGKRHESAVERRPTTAELALLARPCHPPTCSLDAPPVPWLQRVFPRSPPWSAVRRGGRFEFLQLVLEVLAPVFAERPDGDRLPQ